MWKSTLGLLFGLALAIGGFPAHAATAEGTTDAAAPATAARQRQPLTGIPALARIDRDGVLRVGVAVNAPWVMHDKDGALIGYAIDSARQLAGDMGWKLELVETSWPKLLFGLRSNDYDVVISGFSVTARRARQVRFSREVGEVDTTVAVRRAKLAAGGLHELAALAGAKVGARKGELTVDFARRALPAAQIVEIDDEEQAIADLREGRLDAYVAEAPMPEALARAWPQELRVLAEPVARTAHAFAVRPGDGSLARVLDAWVLENRASGWLAERQAYWFEGTAWAAQFQQ